MRVNEEHAILGAALIDPVYVPVVCGELTEDDFYTPEAAIVFRAIQSIWKDEKPVDLVTVASELDRMGELDRVGGAEFVCDLLTYVPTTANTRAYIELLHESRKRRIFERGMRTAVEQAERGEDCFMVTAQDTMDEVHTIGTNGLTSVSDIMPIVLNNLGNTKRGLSTGFSTLDSVCGGFGKGHLVIIAARPAVGKTSFACNVAANMCRVGLVVPFFSIEMGREEIIERVMLSEAQVDKYDINKSTTKIQAVLDIQDRIKSWKLYVDDRGSISIGQIIATCYKIKQVGGGLDCVFVDYIQLMRLPTKTGANTNQLLGEVSRALKLMAKELKCPVVVLSQLNRNAEGRRPTIADLRDSGAIEQDADMVLLLHRENDQSNDTTLIIGKNRHGRTGDIPFVWHPEYTRFLEPVMKDVAMPKGVFNK